MRLMSEATLKAATDPETGRLDLGNLDGSNREREARGMLAEEVSGMTGRRGAGGVETSADRAACWGTGMTSTCLPSPLCACPARVLVQLKKFFSSRKGQSLSVSEIRQAIQAATKQDVKQVRLHHPAQPPHYYAAC